MFAKLWKDEAGIVALEYLLVATIIGLGLVVGLSNLESALNVELTELGNAILGLSQAYSIDGLSGCNASKAGSAVTDTATSTALGSIAPTSTSIDLGACP
jgi:Flp pilus assembly pilin Flp